MCVLAGVAGTVLSVLPLIGDFHYEYALIITWFTAPFTPYFGGILWRHLQAANQKTFLCAMAKTAFGASLPALCALVPIVVRSIFFPSCHFFLGLLFFFLLPILSSVWGATAGAAIDQCLILRLPVLRQKLFFLLAVALPLQGAAWCLIYLYRSPSIKFYHPLWGFFAGSLYDENIVIDAQLIWFRVLTCLSVASFVTVTFLMTQTSWHKMQTLVYISMLGAILFGIPALERARDLNAGFAQIQRHLGVVAVRPHLVVHLPKATPVEQAEAIADDHAYRLAQLSTKMQLTPSFVLHSYVFSDADDKAYWMGGRQTQFAKPWQHAISLHGLLTPHPAVAHEMVHALAAAWTTSLLGVPARYHVFVNLTLVEGLAVALADDGSDLGVMGEAQILNTLGLMPSQSSALDQTSPFSFWQQAPARAYVQAGALLRFVHTHWGIGALRAIYGGAQSQDVLHQDAKQLSNAFRMALQAYEVSDEARALMSGPLKKPSAFGRVCVHEVARLRDRADRQTATRALILRQQAFKLSHGQTNDALAVAATLRTLKRDDDARALEMKLINDKVLAPPEEATLRFRLACDALLQNKEDVARAHLRHILDCPMPLAVVRASYLLFHALQMHLPALTNSLLRLWQGRVDPNLGAIELATVLNQLDDGHDTIRPFYTLLGRLLLLDGQNDAAWVALMRAGRQTLFVLEVERLKLLVDVTSKIGALKAAESYAQALKNLPAWPGQREQASDMLQRHVWYAKNKNMRARR